MNAKHKVKDWLNGLQRNPRTSLRRSVSDFRDRSRMPVLTQAGGEIKRCLYFEEIYCIRPE
jgi:hypothetical protein